MSRADWNAAEFSAIALRTSAGGTTSLTNTCRVGLSTTKTRPPASAKRYTWPTLISPVMVNTARIVVRIPFTVWVIISRRRFG